MSLFQRMRELEPVLAVACLAALVAIVAWSLLQRRRPRHRATRERRPPATQIRQTDSLRLDPEQEARRKTAMELIARGRVREGARVLEELQLQRYAISALENAGLIEDACGMLLRMDRPARAAVLYLRNHMPEKAAPLFLTADLPEDAASAFADAGNRGEPAMSLRAAELFEKIGALPKAMACYARAGDIARFSDLAVRLGAWALIGEAMADDARAVAVLARLGADAAAKAIEAVPLEDAWAARMARWVRDSGRRDVAAAAISRLGRHPELLKCFWGATGSSAEKLAANLLDDVRAIHEQAPQEAAEILRRNAHALHEAGKNQIACLMFESCGRLAMAAKCAALSGDLVRSLVLLEEGGENAFAATLRAELERELGRPLAAGDDVHPWSQTLRESATRLLSTIDPENDALHSVSPFSLAS